MSKASARAIARKLHRATPKAANDPAAPDAAPKDANTVYLVPLKGSQIDVIARAFDALVRVGGLPVAQQLTPVIEAVTAPRISALKAKEKGKT